MRAAALAELSSPTVALGTLRLGGTWSTVDLGDAETVEVLRAYVGTHIKLHPEDVVELEAAGLALVDGRLVETKAEAPSTYDDPSPLVDAPRRGRKR